MNTNTPAGSATGTDLDKLQCYEPAIEEAFGDVDVATMSASDDGEYVKLADVQELLARRAPQPSADRAPADGASIDTPEFRKVLAALIDGDCNNYGSDEYAALVRYIDTRAPTAAPADGAGELVAAIRDRVARIRYIDKSSHDLLIRAANMIEAQHAPTAGDSTIPQPGDDVLLVPQRADGSYAFGAASKRRDWFGTDEELANAGLRLVAFVPRAALAIPQPGVDEAASIKTWQELLFATHPQSESAYWPDSLKCKYMAAEIDDLRAALTRRAPPADRQACAHLSADHWRNRLDQQGAAQAQAGDAAQDAARYRCMRKLLSTNMLKFYQYEGKPESEIDEYIDEAMAAPAQRNGGEQ